MAISINEAKVPPGSQTSNHIYKCIIQLLLCLNGLVGLAWEMLSFLLFSTEKIFFNLYNKQLIELLKYNTFFMLEYLCSGFFTIVHKMFLL